MVGPMGAETLAAEGVGPVLVPVDDGRVVPKVPCSQASCSGVKGGGLSPGRLIAPQWIVVHTVLAKL